MNTHDDERIDAALEALARPEPPADHVARVLARTGLGLEVQAAGARGRAGSPLRLRSGQASRPPAGRLVWSLGTLATVLVALGLTWQVTQIPTMLPESQTARSENGPSPGWGAPQEVVRPVLPPQAYWGMDAFEEWGSLRPGIGSRESGVADIRPGTGDAPSERGRGVPPRRNSTARSSASGGGAPQMAWVPVPSGLPPIELEPITPAPIEIAPLAALENITVADITLAPIEVGPVDQEKP